MTNSLNTNEIKKRSIMGAKWLFVMSGIGMPAAALIALMLGRVGPSALGAYALVQILIGVITTFVIYGGSPVLSVFMPKLADDAERGRFLFSYVLILLTMMMGILFLFWLFPKGFEFLLQREFDMKNYGWFILLAIVITFTETLANTASSLMLIKTAAIARQMMRLILLPLIVFLFFFDREILLRYGMQCILGGFLVGYLIAGTVCYVGILRDSSIKLQKGWLIPPGFWAFSLTSMMGTVFSFLYGNIDRMAVLSLQDLEGLGMYQAVLSINMLVENISMILLPSVIPTFSTLLGTNQYEAFRRAFSMLCRWVVLPITILALTVMAFSREILGLFGQEYTQYTYLLVLFSFAGILRSLRLPTQAILTCKEKNIFKFFQPFFMISAQVVLTFAFMSSFGILAIAGAKMLSATVSSVVGTLYVIFSLGMAKKLPLSYKAAALAGLIMVILRIWVVPDGWISSTVLLLSCVVLFLGISRFGLDEIRGVITFIIHRDASIFEQDL
jgi:O-antigen/teichoic acid export membrane protein